MHNKREKFLKFLTRAEEYKNLTGPGLAKKVKKALLFPQWYFPFVLRGLLDVLSKKRKDVSATLFWGKRINGIDLSDKGAFALYVYHALPYGGEYKLTRFLIKNLTTNDIFFDIGANYGFYTYLALEFCKEVHSFEPHPKIFKNLESNLPNEKKCHINQLAVSDQCGVEQFFCFEENSDAGTLSEAIKGLALENNPKLSYVARRVRATTLDAYVKDYSKPTVIKMDIEGGESKAIEGAQNFLETYSPLISLEVWHDSKWGKKGGNISMHAVQKLRDLGYKSYFINSDGNLEKADGELSLIAKRHNLRFDNFIFRK